MKKFFSAFTFAWMAAIAGSAQAFELVHDPVFTASAGEDVEISAALTGADSSVRVRLFYRVKGKELFRSEEMGGTTTRLSAMIPGKQVETAGVEYYIEAANFVGGVKSTVSSPVAAPDKNPHSIAVRRDETLPELQVLSPLDGDLVSTGQPVITVAFSDADTGIDPASVLIKIDGEAIKDRGNVQAFDSLVSYVPSKVLANGPHTISVAVKDKAGNAGSARWNFKVEAGAEAKASTKGFRWDGSAGYETQYGLVTQQPKTPQSYLPYRPYGVNRGRLDVNGRGEENNLKLKVYKTDEERTDQQPLDRYQASWSNDGGSITLGDITNLSFSPLSLYNLYLLRGVSFDLRSGGLNEGHSRLQAVWGFTRRAVDSGISAFTGTPGSGTYAQELYGVRYEVGGPWFMWGFNHVTVNDQAGSIANAGGVMPNYNMVDTSDIRIGLFWLTLSGEAGFDVASAGSTPLGISVGHSYRGTADLNIKETGTRATFEWRDLGGSFSFGSLALPGGYTTMANPGLQQDYRGKESSLSQTLFDGQFSIGANYNVWIDNLQGQKSTSSGTTTNEFTSLFTSIAPNGLPYLTGVYTQTRLANDLRGNTFTGQYMLANSTESMSISLGHNIYVSERNMFGGNLSWNGINYRDNASLRLSQDLDAANYMASAFTTFGLSSLHATVSLGSTYNQIVRPNLVLVFGQTERTSASTSYGLRWGQQWIERVVDTSLSYDLSQYGREERTAGGNQLNSRSTYRLSAGYNPLREHRLGLAFAYSTVESSGKFVGGKFDDAAAMLLSQLNYTWLF